MKNATLKYLINKYLVSTIISRDLAYYYKIWLSQCVIEKDTVWLETIVDKIIHSFIHSISKNVLSAYHLPGTVQGTSCCTYNR